MTVCFYNLTSNPSYFVSYQFIVVHFLADLYTDGMSTYVINDNDRITNVIVNRKNLSSHKMRSLHLKLFTTIGR